MKKNKIIATAILIAVLFVGLYVFTDKAKDSEPSIEVTQTVSACETAEEYESKLMVRYTSLDVPLINNSFKTWMSYKAVTDKNSPQYKFIHTWGWIDDEGFMRCSGEKDLGIEQDYYLVAFGSYYGTTIGTKYRITLDTGRVFYVVLADCKDDRHTNSTNQYVPINGNMIEFLVDTSKLNEDVKITGSANVYEPLNGIIIKIEKINFIKK